MKKAEPMPRLFSWEKPGADCRKESEYPGYGKAVCGASYVLSAEKIPGKNRGKKRRECPGTDGAMAFFCPQTGDRVFLPGRSNLSFLRNQRLPKGRDKGKYLVIIS